MGRAELQGPTSNGSTAGECKPIDKTFSVIGLARIPTKANSLGGLSWVEGAAIDDSNSENGTVDKSFHLGTTPNLSFNGTVLLRSSSHI